MAAIKLPIAVKEKVRRETRCTKCGGRSVCCRAPDVFGRVGVMCFLQCGLFGQVFMGRLLYHYDNTQDIVPQVRQPVPGAACPSATRGGERPWLRQTPGQRSPQESTSRAPCGASRHRDSEALSRGTSGPPPLGDFTSRTGKKNGPANQIPPVPLGAPPHGAYLPARRPARPRLQPTRHTAFPESNTPCPSRATAGSAGWPSNTA